MPDDYLSLDGKSNHAPYCYHCGAPITIDNDSGWQVFTSDGHTQSVCGLCHSEQAQVSAKADMFTDDESRVIL
jgi:hypothetical protein